MNEFVVIVGVWLLIVALVVAIDVGPGWIEEKLNNRPKKKPNGRHKLRK